MVGRARRTEIRGKGARYTNSQEIEQTRRKYYCGYSKFGVLGSSFLTCSWHHSARPPTPVVAIVLLAVLHASHFFEIEHAATNHFEFETHCKYFLESR